MQWERNNGEQSLILDNGTSAIIWNIGGYWVGLNLCLADYSARRYFIGKLKATYNYEQEFYLSNVHLEIAEYVAKRYAERALDGLSQMG